MIKAGEGMVLLSAKNKELREREKKGERERKVGEREKKGRDRKGGERERERGITCPVRERGTSK